MDIDVAIATEHISLAAAEQGLGSCWVCNFDTDLCRKHFNLPDTIEPAVILTIGYPESPDLFEQTPKKRKTLEEIIKEGKPHGTMKLGFTPDEEIGSGADYFDVEGFGCDYAYTVDGGTLGELEYENFNAAAATVEVEGFPIHTGGAKDKMINSMSIAMEYCSLLPQNQVPEHTELYEGFIHLDSIKGNVEHTVMQFLIRDHDSELFQKKKELMGQAASYINVKYPSQPLTLTVKDTYYNMKEKILPRMDIIESMERAMRENGVEPFSLPIRGGTDGARLSFMGLPCPNICTGGANAHGKMEYVVVEDMEKIKDIIKTAIYNVE